ncbi:MAG: holo-ACP synthase [Gammaproteobacteria bacterium]|jgi:holo-[acyl-carrier protein] synthase
MIFGLGTDIAEIVRVAEVYESTGDGFVDRILTEEEKQKIPKNPALIPAYLAKRFAVKEAAAKALGTGINKGVSFLDFTTTHNELGAPSLVVTGKAAEIAASEGIHTWHVSISDEKHYAVATVITEK